MIRVGFHTPCVFRAESERMIDLVHTAFRRERTREIINYHHWRVCVCCAINISFISSSSFLLHKFSMLITVPSEN